ncbi:Rsm22-domain-containing protein [Thozetella sp. PMI_491]|nr:Rsm22-domain-containing protein [Thozetella sp. PMI_491]
MLSARRAKNSCPQCRSLVLNFYETGFLQLLPRSRAIHAPLRQWRPRTVAPRAQQRNLFSSTPRSLQPQTSDGSHPDAENAPIEENDPEVSQDMDIIVRQARQTFGNTLPPDYLTPEEYKLYERLYGPPLRETQPEDVGISFRGENGEAIDGDMRRHTLLRETAAGGLEEVSYTISNKPVSAPDGGQELSDETAVDDLQPLTDAQIDYLNVTANNQREYDALVKLQRDFEAASLRAADEQLEYEEEIQEEPEEDEPEEDEEWDEPDAEFGEADPGRYHPLTLLGKFETSPSTLQLSQRTFVGPIATLLKRTDAKHLKQAAEKSFGAPGLPYSPSTPDLKHNIPMRGLGIEAGHHRMSEIEADAFIAAALPGIYASVMSVLVETRKRLGSNWLRGLINKGGPRVLDFGAGGAGLVAWQEILDAEWAVLRDQGLVTELEPPGKKTVVVGSDALRHRVSRFLHNTTFLPRLPDYLHSANLEDRQLDGTPVAHKKYDIIIATHTLMSQVTKTYKRKAVIDNLWSMLSPEGGVLIILEKGHPRGFEAIANVRDRMLDKYIIPPSATPPPPDVLVDGEPPAQREPGMIIAPCTSHGKCPMYQTPGESPGRKDFCHFRQRYIRPPFLQKIVGATHKNHEDIKFSYIAVRRGAYDEQPLISTEGQAQPELELPFVQGKETTLRAFAGYENAAADGVSPHPLTLPRLVLTPIKRRGHITIDVCTSEGQIERWTVPKSFSKQAYRDARKSDWGDLWALGAKTRVPRRVRVGRGSINAEEASQKNPNDGGVRSRRAAQQASAAGRRGSVVELSVHPERGVLGAYEKFPAGRAPQERRMGKGGRKLKVDDLMKELDVLDYDEEDERDQLVRAAQVNETRRVLRKERGKK